MKHGAAWLPSAGAAGGSDGLSFTAEWRVESGHNITTSRRVKLEGGWLEPGNLETNRFIMAAAARRYTAIQSTTRQLENGEMCSRCVRSL